MRVLLTVTAAVLAAAPAASADRTRNELALDRAIAGRTAGRPIECIPRRQNDDFRTAGRYLIFRAGSRVTYVNELSEGCGADLSHRALVFRSTSSQICRGEIAEAVDPYAGTGGGSCTLGAFVPYAR